MKKFFAGLKEAFNLHRAASMHYKGIPVIQDDVTLYLQLGIPESSIALALAIGPHSNKPFMIANSTFLKLERSLQEAGFEHEMGHLKCKHHENHTIDIIDRLQCGEASMKLEYEADLYAAKQGKPIGKLLNICRDDPNISSREVHLRIANLKRSGFQC